MIRRAIAVLCALTVVFGGLAVRVWMLSGASMQTVTATQSSRTKTIAVARGTIYDRYGQPLVNRCQCTVALLSSTPASVDMIYSLYPEQQAQEAAKRLSHGERMTITLPRPDPSLTCVEVPVRYGEDPLAVHLVGYIDGEGRGVCGLEKAYDTQLHTDDAVVTATYQVDALGRTTVGSTDVVENTLTLSSRGIMVTLDSQIQQIVSATSRMYIDRGAVLVSQARSGELLAMLSLPLYDPSEVDKALDREDAPLIDRTLLNYNPGSVFKIITAAAALESGISENRQFLCEGAVTVDGVAFGCHNEDGHGVLDMREAMACSCNCYFIQLALEVGGEAIAQMAQKARFGTMIDIADGLQTSPSVLPSRADLSVKAAVANFSIGQGDLLASSIHVQALLGAVANGGVWNRPNVYLGTVDENGKTVRVPKDQSERLFSARTANKLKGMLAQVVATGTGYRAATEHGASAGKTGTAQTGWLVNGKEIVQSWFSGYYPADDPQYIITVLSENGGSTGKTAAPLFAAICDELYASGLVEKAADPY